MGVAEDENVFEFDVIEKDVLGVEFCYGGENLADYVKFEWDLVCGFFFTFLAIVFTRIL